MQLFAARYVPTFLARMVGTLRASWEEGEPFWDLARMS